MLGRIRGLRALAPVLPLAVALGTGAARADLNRLQTVAIRQSGHGPLGLLWILQSEGKAGMTSS